MIVTISCKNGRVFSAMREDAMDAEMKLRIAYYKAQGCNIDNLKDDNFEFNKKHEHECEHCSSLEHEFENLIDEITGEDILMHEEDDCDCCANCGNEY